MRALLIEDNQILANLLTERLLTRGIEIDWACDLSSADTMMLVGCYDAIILDQGLPDGDGVEWLRVLSKDHPPVLILSARATIDDRIQGLDYGADDYLVKPADVEEIAARLRAIMRRPGTREHTTLSFDSISFNPKTREVLVDNNPISLSHKEIAVLEVLLRRANRVVVREVLEGIIYGASEPVTPNALEAVVSRLRRRLSDYGQTDILHTVRGVGYYLGRRQA